MINKLFITLILLSAYEVNSKFQPKQYIAKYDEATEVVVTEYESACIRKDIRLSGKGYTCKDLKKYLYKRGYKSFD